MYYLKMTLEGVLQSYASDENIWRTRRDTQPAPTKSAVMGIIGCSLGLREEDYKYKKLNNLVYLYKQNRKSMTIDDYQMIRPKEHGKSFEESRFWSPNGSHSGVQYPTNKEYLADASFTVYVGCEDEHVLKRIHEALRNPVWAYYLGRACCTPGKPIAEKECVLIDKMEEQVCTCL